MPVSASTISSTRSQAGGRRLVPDPTAPCRGTAVTAIASPPQAVTGPPTSRVNPTSRPAGRNRAGNGIPGPTRSRAAGAARVRRPERPACSPSDPSARPPWSPSYSRRYRQAGRDQQGRVPPVIDVPLGVMLLLHVRHAGRSGAEPHPPHRLRPDRHFPGGGPGHRPVRSAPRRTGTGGSSRPGRATRLLLAGQP